MATELSLDKLLEVGAHFGHQYKRWNPKMKPFMYTVKDGVYVFDLVKTHELLKEALEAIKDFSSRGKTILFIGTKKQAKDKIKEIAEKTSCPYINERWLGGTLTNFDQIGKSIKNLNELKEKVKVAKKEGYTKKERLLMARQIEKLKKNFGGIIGLEALPDLMVIFDTHKEAMAVKEANKLGIPIVGVVDSNADPEGVNWPVPMNDDATKAVEYVLDLFCQAVLDGKGKDKKLKKNGDK